MKKSLWLEEKEWGINGNGECKWILGAVSELPPIVVFIIGVLIYLLIGFLLIWYVFIPEAARRDKKEIWILCIAFWPFGCPEYLISYIEYRTPDILNKRYNRIKEELNKE